MLEGNLRPDKACIAALRDNGCARLMRQSQNARDLLDAGRPKNERRLALIQSSPLDKVGLHVLRLAEGVSFAYDRGEARERFLSDPFHDGRNRFIAHKQAQACAGPRRGAGGR